MILCINGHVSFLNHYLDLAKRIAHCSNLFARIYKFMNMIFRVAELSDIKQIQGVRHLVKENTLSNPDLVPDKDVAYYISEKGKGWVCELNGQIVGFSIIDLLEKS